MFGFCSVGKTGGRAQEKSGSCANVVKIVKMRVGEKRKNKTVKKSKNERFHARKAAGWDANYVIICDFTEAVASICDNHCQILSSEATPPSGYLFATIVYIAYVYIYVSRKIYIVRHLKYSQKTIKHPSRLCLDFGPWLAFCFYCPLFCALRSVWPKIR